MRLTWHAYSCLAAVLLASCATHPDPSPPTGLRYLNQAQSLRQLRAQTHPTLSWQESDGSWFFLWCATNNQGPTFTMDRAYYIHQNSKAFWCFIDLTSGANLDFQHPIRQFLACQFLRETISPGGRHGDGNHSYAELLAKAPNNASVYKLVYASQGGWRAHQEEIRTFLIYHTPSGHWHLAAHELGREGAGKVGVIGYYRWLELHVNWLSNTFSAPLEIALKKCELLSENSEDATLPNLYIFEKGVLTGSFPLKKKMSGMSYTESDGQITLRNLASTLIGYNASWLLSDWVSSESRMTVTNLWLDALKQVNPAYKEDQVLPKGFSIILPPERKLKKKAFDAARREAVRTGRLKN